MIVSSCQRWRSRRDSYRPAGDVFDPGQFEVAPIAGDNVAKAFVLAHHYSGSYPSARFRYGLYDRRGELVGIAVFAVPANYATFRELPCDPKACVTLGRFVLLDDVKANAESWFLARCFEDLRAHAEGVVSFSDPCPRTSSAGDVVFGGHVGTIYQATNAVYRGRSKAEGRWMFPDGTMVEPRALSKIRKRDQGWQYAAAQLEAFGAAELGDHQDPVAWLKTWLLRLCRRVSHPGNHKYLWALHRRDRRHLPPSLPYPKMHTPRQLGLLEVA